MNEKTIFLLGNDEFSTHINNCLVEDSLESEVGLKFPCNKTFDTVIIPFLNFDCEKEKQLDTILKSKTKKIILLENGLDIYLNSKNGLPYSVYSKLVPKNEICERFLEIEKKVKESKKQHVIFRISEVYGISTPKSLVNQLLFCPCCEIENSVRDFIYDGDVISAIEIALRKEVSGIFDIASGQSVELKKLFELIKKISQEDREIQWTRKKTEIVFNCENFKFYKWQPLVNLEVGLKTLLTFGRNYGKLRSTQHSVRKNF